jgi:hypothetical protein
LCFCARVSRVTSLGRFSTSTAAPCSADDFSRAASDSP